MLLASKIQESLSSPRDFVTDGGLTCSFYHRKVGMLGGDWGAAKQHADGNTYIVVVDATGKGVAAALVVHAVQALWAAEISQPSFDPEPWITSVNRTLLALGRKAPQTLSMGLLAIGGGILRYYSAGHVPLYVIESVAGAHALRTLPSRGPMLGLSETIQLVVGEIDLREDGLRWILGGTDGIFTRETRFSRRRGMDLIKTFETQGPEALLDTATDDDKILFVLEKAA
jgi:serine phosphatase RsbU (regulator of sigma subunit)